MKIKSQYGQPDSFYIVSNPQSKMAICDYLDAKSGNLYKHVVKAYMYIKGASPSIPPSFPHMTSPSEITLLADSAETSMLLPTLSPTLIPNYNSFEHECNATWLAKGMKRKSLISYMNVLISGRLSSLARLLIFVSL